MSTEKERSRAKFLARVAREQQEREARQPHKAVKDRLASRAEQHARYLDCGPLAWDDRGSIP